MAALGREIPASDRFLPLNTEAGRGKVPPMFGPRKISASKAALLGLAALGAVGLAGCSGSGLTDPYFITVPSQTVDREGGGALFSVCYNKTLHTPQEIAALVRQHCADPKLRYSGSDLQRCSLAAPARATYSCSAISRTAAEAKQNLPESDSFTGSIVF